MIEELDPYLENQIKQAGIECIGKGKIPAIGELNPNIIAERFLGKRTETIQVKLRTSSIALRLCRMPPPRLLLRVGQNQNIMIASDIGCYGLMALNGKDTCVCMGVVLEQAMELR